MMFLKDEADPPVAKVGQLWFAHGEGIVAADVAAGKNDGRVLGIDDSTIKVREEYVDFHGEKTSKEIDMRIRQSQGG